LQASNFKCLIAQLKKTVVRNAKKAGEKWKCPAMAGLKGGSECLANAQGESPESTEAVLSEGAIGGRI